MEYPKYEELMDSQILVGKTSAKNMARSHQVSMNRIFCTHLIVLKYAILDSICFGT